MLQLSSFDKNVFIMPPDGMIGGHIGFVLSVPVHVCVYLLSTETFAITFEPKEIETSYLACILY